MANPLARPPHCQLLQFALEEYGDVLSGTEAHLFKSVAIELKESNEIDMHVVFSKVSPSQVRDALHFLRKKYIEIAQNEATDDDTSADMSMDAMEIGCILRWMDDNI